MVRRGVCGLGFVAVVVALGLAGGAAQAGLLGYWNFDDGTGSATVADVSGSGIHGALVGMDPATDWVPSMPGHGTALDFDGGNDYVSMGAASATGLATSSLTVSFWANADSGIYQVPVAKHPTGSSGQGWTAKFRTAGEGHDLWWRIGSLGNTNSTFKVDSVYTPGTWEHYALTYDGGTAKIYVGGVLRGVQTGIAQGVNDTTTEMRVGRCTAITEYFDGKIDDVAVFDTALSDGGLAVGQRPTWGSEMRQLVDDGPAAVGKPITGGTGPGGFERADTASSLLYWLKADALALNNGDPVATWADHSSNGNDFAQANAVNQPTLAAAALGGNALPAVRFDGDNSDPDGTDPLLVGANSDKLVLNTATSPRTVFLVNSTFQHRSLDGIWGRDDSDHGIRRENANAWRAPGNVGDFTYTGAMFVNGVETGAAALNTPHIVAATGTGNYPGTNLGNYFQYGHAAGARAWNGDVGEVVVYDRELNSAERQVVENYLSAKYDIPLAANDHYTGDDAAKGDYDLDVCGIGRVDAANQLTLAGSAGFGIRANGTLADGDWVMAGHKTPTNALTRDDVPTGYARYGRVWYVDPTGSPSATLAFDPNMEDMPTTAPGTQFALVHSATNAFNFSKVDAAPTVSGDQVGFSLSDTQLQAGYYTLRQSAPTSAPGGFEAADGPSGLLYWLRADAGVMKDGAGNVSAWLDQGSAGNDFAQADPLKQPVLVDGAIGGNALPAVQFDGHPSSHADADKLILSTSTQPRTIIAVNEILSYTSLGGIIGREGGDLGIREYPSGSWRHPGNVGDYTNPSGSEMYINGALSSNGAVGIGTPHILTATRTTAYTFPTTGLGRYFYDHPTNGVRAYNGNIGEVLVFDRVLNAAERIIVENALSAKYDIALGANDRYRGDQASFGDYDREVIGIGRVDAANQVTRASGAGLTIEALGGSLGDDEWLLAGLQSTANSWLEATDADPTVFDRWERVWYLDVTGDLDALLTFDHLIAGDIAVPDLPLALLYSESNAYAFARLGGTGIVDGSQVSFAVPGRLLAPGYYTVGTVPEPATLSLLGLGALALLRRRRRA